MQNTIQKYLMLLFTMPWPFLFLMAACTDTLIAAYILEHYFDVFPCQLCIYQRIPFAIVIFLSIIPFFIRMSFAQARVILWLCALAFLANVGVSIYHSGVELQWWAGTNGCGVNLADTPTDTASLREALLVAPTVRCDDINFTFLGLTLANWNIPWSFALALFAGLGATYHKWGKQ